MGFKMMLPSGNDSQFATLKMAIEFLIYLLKMGILQFAILVYRRLVDLYGV